jgi:hypothetical protein
MTRTAARYLTAFALAAAIALLISVPWAGARFWVLMLAVTTVGVAWVTGVWIRMGRELDAAVEDINANVGCGRLGHAYRRKPMPVVWVCTNCGDLVESSAGWMS